MFMMIHICLCKHHQKCIFNLPINWCNVYYKIENVTIIMEVCQKTLMWSRTTGQTVGTGRMWQITQKGHKDLGCPSPMLHTRNSLFLSACLPHFWTSLVQPSPHSDPAILDPKSQSPVSAQLEPSCSIQFCLGLSLRPRTSSQCQGKLVQDSLSKLMKTMDCSRETEDLDRGCRPRCWTNRGNQDFSHAVN